ncbi:gp19 [Corynebacterium phage P1201]|uniref:Gp19 n=1 Tax=Corynebacterium phage P1201 TaxID=384848 RepID=A7IY90_9CAUD|nr:gp19 [Corynebacterium phage P1201]ABF57473.1 gp19 [Corynebacterium phage P1201]
MDYFENFMEEAEKFLERADALLEEITKEQEPEKKGVSWDELSDWVAESEGVQEFEEDTDAEQPVYVTKEADLHAECENCEQCGECGCDEYLNHDSYDEEFWEWIEEEREQEDEWDASERISLLDYREGLFRHLREQNPKNGNDKLFLLTNIVSDLVWEIAEGPDVVTFGENPEDRRAGLISSAHRTIEGSSYLLALIEESLGSISVYVNLHDAETEIQKYLKGKN